MIPMISVRIEHLILLGLNHCLSYWFISFFQLLRRRSHVRIVLGRPSFTLLHTSLGCSIGTIVADHDLAWLAYGWPWVQREGSVDYQQLSDRVGWIEFWPWRSSVGLTRLLSVTRRDAQAALRGWLTDTQNWVIGGGWVAENGQK